MRSTGGGGEQDGELRLLANLYGSGADEAFAVGGLEEASTMDGNIYGSHDHTLLPGEDGQIPPPSAPAAMVVTGVAGVVASPKEEQQRRNFVD